MTSELRLKPRVFARHYPELVTRLTRLENLAFIRSNLAEALGATGCLGSSPCALEWRNKLSILGPRHVLLAADTSVAEHRYQPISN